MSRGDSLFYINVMDGYNDIQFKKILQFDHLFKDKIISDIIELE